MAIRNKSLQDSFVFRHLNGPNNRIEDAVTQIIKSGTVLNKGNLEQAFLTINKSFKYSLKQKVMDAYEQGSIILMYSPEGVKLPTALPFFLFKGNQGVKAVVAVDIHGNMDKETKDVTIDAKKLYVTMEAAFIAIDNFNKVQTYSKRTNIITLGSNMYANMVARCLNKKYALNVDKVKLHKVQFITAKFFIMSIMQFENEEIANNYAGNVCVGANNLILQDVANMVLAEDLKDLQSLIDVLKRPELNLGMTDLTVRGFLEMFINMYHHSSVLALELFPYFVYNINSAVHGAYINNQYMLEDIIDKVGPKFYVAIAQTV